MVGNLSIAFSSETNKATNLHKKRENIIKYLAFIFMTLVTLMLSHNAYALSTVTAVVDKNPAMTNESILLTITADDDVDRDALDTSALAKDFIVGQTRVSSQTSIVNFDATRLTTWKIILIARKAGQYTIPALTIENLQTMPISLAVIAGTNKGSQNQTDIFITSELSSNEVYVQQSLTLSIKLHFAVELHSASMDKPEFTGAMIEKVGEDQQSDSIINGKRYRIIEQTYAVTPEQSGEFIIKGPMFSGEVRQGSSRRSAFSSFAQTKPVSVIGDDLKINVLPIPANYPSNAEWLPTDILTLHQEWQGNNGEFIAGEPITRTIRLTASGLSKAQLPKLEMQNSPGLKVYPDQAELHSSLRDNRLISQKVQNFALVPSAAGDFTLPEMKVTWFNTITNKIEQATLPEQTISVVLPKDGSVIPTVNKSNEQAVINNQAHPSPVMCDCSANEIASPDVVTSKDDKNFQWLFLTLWVLTLILWFTHVTYLSRTKGITKKIQTKRVNNSANYNALVTACKHNNAEDALSHILPWLKQLLVNDKSEIRINNIAQAIQVISDDKFTESYNELEAYLYGKGAENTANTWQASALLSAIKTINQKHSKSGFNNKSVSLNP